MPFDPNALSASVRARWQQRWEPLRDELVAEFARIAATPGLDPATRDALLAQGQALPLTPAPPPSMPLLCAPHTAGAAPAPLARNPGSSPSPPA